MSGSMQIFVIEQRLYELEEKVFKFLKDANDRLAAYEIKMEKYEEFLMGYEGGSRLPKKVQAIVDGEPEKIPKSKIKLINIKKANAEKEKKRLMRIKNGE